MLKFGDVFIYKERDYVYLAKTEDILYVAQIISKGFTKRLNGLYKKKMHEKKGQKPLDRPIFCFVMLSTKEFEGRAAHLYNPGHDEDMVYNSADTGCSLNEKDLKTIKDEIEVGPVPIQLKELVKDVDIS